jgi:23S rRNA (cytosine1962-C5)-methyltransferase
MKSAILKKRPKKSIKKLKSNNIKEVFVHPTSLKYLEKGHPWVTRDSYSKSFPDNEIFIKVKSLKNKNDLILLNDPDHPKVKARFWDLMQKGSPVSKEKYYQRLETVLQERIKKAIQYRLDQNIPYKREHFYLAFGEADRLPGLHILKLKNHLYIQYFAKIWSKLENQLLSSLEKALKEAYLIESYVVWIQHRGMVNHNKKAFYLKGRKPYNGSSVFSSKESNFQIECNMNASYDIGLYPDMSGIRNKLTKNFKNKKRVLNLFSYTGAFSLQALAQEIPQVYSVDLSAKYLNMLERNISLNPGFKSFRHQSICKPVNKALDNMARDNQKFDLIICDPPSASSDGKNKLSSFKNYHDLIMKMDKVLEPKGEMIIFLNTHSIERKKFREKIYQYLKELKLENYKIVQDLGLVEDCPRINNFPEGDYLKGFVLSRK